MDEFQFEVVAHIGVLAEKKGGWKKELNIVSWNGAKPKYDIRDWSKARTNMSKGVTLKEDEVLVLRDLLMKL